MTVFKVIIRIVFLFAYAAFLYASLHHVAYFYHSFEQDGNNWLGSYALAIAIDVTALVLMIGVMFFHKGMPLSALIGTWFFIFCLTGFSWVINWEYAVQFQSTGLDKVGSMYWINPIMASAFAFLNLAYSVVAGFFNSEPESIEELQQKRDTLKQISILKQEIATLKNQHNSSWISGKVQMFKDAFSPENVPAIQQQNTDTLEPDVPEILPEKIGKIERKVPQILEEKSVPQVTKPSQYFMTFEEAVRYTGYAEVTLRKQLKAGEIEANKNGDKLKVSTLRIRTGHTSQMPAVKVEQVPATNGHH
jgi:hypothetical protein